MDESENRAQYKDKLDVIKQGVEKLQSYQLELQQKLATVCQVLFKSIGLERITHAEKYRGPIEIMKQRYPTYKERKAAFEKTNELVVKLGESKTGIDNIAKSIDRASILYSPKTAFNECVAFAKRMLGHQITYWQNVLDNNLLAFLGKGDQKMMIVFIEHLKQLQSMIDEIQNEIVSTPDTSASEMRFYHKVDPSGTVVWTARLGKPTPNNVHERSVEAGKALHSSVQLRTASSVQAMRQIQEAVHAKRSGFNSKEKRAHHIKLIQEKKERRQIEENRKNSMTASKKLMQEYENKREKAKKLEEEQRMKARNAAKASKALEAQVKANNHCTEIEEAKNKTEQLGKKILENCETISELYDQSRQSNLHVDFFAFWASLKTAYDDICKAWDSFKEQFGTMKNIASKFYRLNLESTTSKEYKDVVTECVDNSKDLKKTLVEAITKTEEKFQHLYKQLQIKAPRERDFLFGKKVEPRNVLI